MRIALLEDDRATAEIIKVWLESGGHHVYMFHEGQALINALHRDSYDLLILDWILPDIGGDEVLRWVRQNLGWKVPVLFLTSRNSKDDIVAGLQLGADDYMTKPVSAAELLARVSVLARRFANLPQEDQIIDVPPFLVDQTSRTFKRNGEPVQLTQKEFELGSFLLRNIGRLLSRDHILETVWARNPNISTRTVDIHVSRLRKKLGLTEENGWRLSAIYHHGYRLEKL